MTDFMVDSFDTKVSQVYQYLRQIGIENKKADRLITEDLGLRDKPCWLMRVIENLAAKMGLIKNPTQDPHRLIYNISSFITEHPEIAERTKKRAEFIKCALLQIAAKKDKHLELLGQLNQFRATLKNCHPDVKKEGFVAYYKELKRLYLQREVDDMAKTHLAIKTNIALVNNLQRKAHITHPVPTSAIDLLPEEKFVEILSYLPHTDLLKVRSVCRKWQRIAEDQYLWKQLAENKLLHRFGFGPQLSYREAFQKHSILVTNIKEKHFSATTESLTTLCTGYAHDHRFFSSNEYLCLSDESHFHFLEPGKSRTFSRRSNEEIVQSDDGRFITLTKDQDPQVIKVWDLEKGEPAIQRRLPAGVYVTRATAVQNRIYLFSNEDASNTYMLDLQTGEIGNLLAYVDINQKVRGSLCFDHEKTDHNISYIDLHDFEAPAKTFQNTAQCSIIALKGDLAFLRTELNNIRVFDIPTQKEIGLFTTGIGANNRFSDVAIHQGILFAFNEKKDRIKCWDLVTRAEIGTIAMPRLLRNLHLHQGKIFSIQRMGYRNDILNTIDLTQIHRNHFMLKEKLSRLIARGVKVIEAVPPPVVSIVLGGALGIIMKLLSKRRL